MESITDFASSVTREEKKTCEWYPEFIGDSITLFLSLQLFSHLCVSQSDTGTYVIIQ